MNGTQPEGSRMARLAGTVLWLDKLGSRGTAGAVESRSGGEHRHN